MICAPIPPDAPAASAMEVPGPLLQAHFDNEAQCLTARDLRRRQRRTDAYERDLEAATRNIRPRALVLAGLSALVAGPALALLMAACA